MTISDIEVYVNVLRKQDVAVLALQMNVGLVKALLEGFDIKVDPYQFVLLAGTYPTYITNGKGHYLSVFGKRGNRVVELSVPHKQDFIEGKYLTRGI